MLILADKNFKTAIRNMFKDLKQTNLKELTDDFVTVAH